MKNINKAITILLINLFLFTTAVVFAASDYNPPFEMSGIVVSVGDDHIEVHMPYINKKVKVLVSAKTFICNRLKDKTKQCLLNEISVEDLVVIKGIVQKEVFLSTEISFLPN